SQRHAELLRELRAIKREINSVPKNRDLSLVAYASLVQLHRFFYFATFLVGSSRIDLLRPPPAVWRCDGCANHFRGLVERRDHRVAMNQSSEHRPLEKSWRCGLLTVKFAAKRLKSLALPRGLEPLFSP